MYFKYIVPFNITLNSKLFYSHVALSRKNKMVSDELYPIKWMMLFWISVLHLSFCDRPINLEATERTKLSERFF
jgi:hypothetical protein